MFIKMVRHGEVKHLSEVELRKTDKYPDLELTDTGVKQASRIPTRINGYMPFIGISSPAIRALQTFKPVSKTYNLIPLILPGLKSLEIRNLKIVADVIEDHNKGKKVWTEAWFEGEMGIERPEEFFARSASAFRWILKRFGAKENLLITAHQETIWAANSFFHKQTFDRKICDLDINFCHIANYWC